MTTLAEAALLIVQGLEDGAQGVLDSLCGSVVENSMPSGGERLRELALNSVDVLEWMATDLPSEEDVLSKVVGF